MKDLLAKFKRGDLSLRALIADLEAILGILESEELSVRLRDKWGSLEGIYSVALVLRGGTFDRDSDRALSAATDGLVGAIDDLIVANASSR